MQIKQEIREGAMIPKYYGVAYLEMDRLIAIAYPIPLNVLVGAWRKFYQWFKAPESLFKSGYDKGYMKGEREGRDYAFNQYKDQVLRQEIKTIIENFLGVQDEAFKLMRTDKEAVNGWIYNFIENEKKRINGEVSKPASQNRQIDMTPRQ